MKHVADTDVLFLLQYICVNLMSRGYVYHSETVLPARKEEKWPKIMDKIQARYTVKAGKSVFQLSKDQRARRKKQGLLNAALVRWRDRFYLLATEGRDDVGLREHERLAKWPQVRLVIPAGLNFTYEIAQAGGKPTVILSKECYEGKKAYFEHLAKQQPLSAVQAAFAREERLMPSYKGIFLQKRHLVKAIARAGREAGKKEFRINAFVIHSKRPTITVMTSSPR